MPTAQWKIFYTDESTLLWSDLNATGDPARMAAAQRIGVHSIVQMIDNDTVRESIEQYHYLFSKRHWKWMGLGIDGLLDLLVNDFDDIACVLHGRTSPTDIFWSIKQNAMGDTDLPGFATAKQMADEEAMRHSLGKWRDPYYQNSSNGQYIDPLKEQWYENQRHRMTDRWEEPPYGRPEFYS